jgi:hypothetical protein
MKGVERVGKSSYNLSVSTYRIFFQNYRVFGLCPSSGILKTREHKFRKLGLFPSSDEGEDTLEIANFNN